MQIAKWYALQMYALIGKEPELAKAISIALKGTGLDLAVDPNAVQMSRRQIARTGFSTRQETFLLESGIRSDELPLFQRMIASANFTLAGSKFSDLFIDPTVVATLKQAAVAYSTFGADRNNDSKVDCSDLDLIEQAFGKRVGDPGFTVAADVNTDGVIDVRDLALVSQHLAAGAHCQ